MGLRQSLRDGGRKVRPEPATAKHLVERGIPQGRSLTTSRTPPVGDAAQLGLACVPGSESELGDEVFAVSGLKGSRPRP